jgi:hypothetical protein
MAVTVYDCSTALGTFVPEADCLKEGSRIVGAYLVKKGYDIELLIDLAALTTAITAGNIKPVTGLAGNWAAATSNKKPGMGFQQEKHSSWSYAIPLKHYGVDGNLTFWNTVNGSAEWSMLFVFEDLSIWGALTTDKEAIPMDIVMTPVSEEELGGVRRMEGSATWRGYDLPYKLNSTVIGAFTPAVLSAQFR